jgi:SAM-dependent methyltransferase
MIEGTDYDRTFGAFLDYAQLADFVHDAMETTVLVDLACGTGSLLASVARRHSGTRLVGVDLSLNQLEIAKRKIPAATFLHSDICETAIWGEHGGPAFDAHLGFAFLNTVAPDWRRRFLERTARTERAQTLTLEIWNLEHQLRSFPPDVWSDFATARTRGRSRCHHLDADGRRIRIEFEFLTADGVIAVSNEMHRFPVDDLVRDARAAGWRCAWTGHARYRPDGGASHDVVRLER